jgi:hypothetical protein
MTSETHQQRVLGMAAKSKFGPRTLRQKLEKARRARARYAAEYARISEQLDTTIADLEAVLATGQP